MDRRGFLRLLGMGAVGAAATATLDIERLLWVPGAKTIFLPPEGQFIGNHFVTSEWITREALRILENSLTFSKQINREYEAAFVTGNSLRIRTPQRFS